MRRFAKLLQKKLGLEKMTFADLKVPVDPEAPAAGVLVARILYLDGTSETLLKEIIVQ